MIVTVLISIGALLVSVAAYFRAGSQYVEQKRDRLLLSIADQVKLLHEQDSELIALEHEYAGSIEAVRQLHKSLLTETELLRDAVRQQIATFLDRYREVARATGWRLSSRLTEWHITFEEQAMQLAPQTRDISLQIARWKDRLKHPFPSRYAERPQQSD